MLQDILWDLDIQKYSEIISTNIISFSGKLLGAILVLWIGFKIVGFITHSLQKYFEKADFDPTVEQFIINLLKYTLKILVCFTAIWLMWVQMTSFVALMAAAGFAIGGALSGTLSHFASGIVILVFRPFKVWDFVELNGTAGTVSDVSIFSTTLTMIDTKLAIIPNSDAISGTMMNYSTEPIRRIDLPIGISYSDDIDLARKTLLKIIKKDPRVLQDESQQVVVKELGDSAVTLGLRFWTKNEDYWQLRFDLLETIKKEFDKTQGKLNFPFPQRDIHLYQEQ